MPRGTELSTTSYAVLGLLGVQPWSTYELTRQMDRRLGRFWPRAVSKLYEEPKKLVGHGLAEAREEQTGRRPRTVYSITPAGRTALAAWTARPGAGPVLEFEQLVKVAFAENGSRDDALRSLAGARAWAAERNAEHRTAARQDPAGEGEFPQRAQSVLVGRFLTEYYRMVAEWADWAAGQVAGWPDDPAQAELDPAALRETAARADWS